MADSAAAKSGVKPSIPDWITKDCFIDILKDNITGFKRIIKFHVSLIAGDGENYASIVLRIEIRVELLYGSVKDVAYILKTLPQSQQAQMMTKMMDLFPKELILYDKYIPEFEQMYLEVGKQVSFSPKFYRFTKDPGIEYILLEDLSPMGFKNGNRLEGLDMEHMESAIKLLAAFHAASAKRHETEGEYDAILKKPMFRNEDRAILENMGKEFVRILIECMNSYEIGKKYAKKVKKLVDTTVDEFLQLTKADPNDFNVVLHGDLWVNNILYRYNDEGKQEETAFIDFQNSRYGSPVIDLYYFLLSSAHLDIKLSQFDHFVKYYHDQLVLNLNLLHYRKNIPTLKDLHIDLLRKSFYATFTITRVMAMILLDPKEDANLDNLLEAGTDGVEFKTLMFKNPRYVKHMEAILPWLDLRGLLD